MTSDTDVQVVGFFAADHAVVSEGKVFVNGGFWDIVRFPSYPQVLTVAVVAVLRVPFHAYLQDHKFEVTAQDADQREVLMRVEGGFRMSAEVQMRVGDPSILPLAMMGQITITKPGDFSFSLQVDGTPLARYPFRAIQIAGQTPSQGRTPEVTGPEAGED